MPFWNLWRSEKPMQTPAERQEEAIAFLASPEAHPGTAGGVERIDTHGAVIFLAGARALKLKRAVKLAYLDFSSIEKRRAALERELTLNKRTAPELYLGLKPVIRRADGTLGLGDGEGQGEVLDWVLEMNRFDQDALLDRLASQGALSRTLLEALAHSVHGFHRAAPSVPRSDWPASLDRVAGTVRAALAHEAFAPLDLHDAITRLDAELLHLAQLMHERRRAGFVRRCHGDMHLNNIVLIGGEPRLFDALEFDEKLATIDILYDLAFLLMDLWRRGLREGANCVLNSYFIHAASAREWEGLRLMPLFMALRAGVRAMVGLDELNLKQDTIRLQEGIRDYARLFAALIAPPPPRLVAVGGLSGTGKTTVARALAPSLGVAPGAIHLRSDVERKAMFRAGTEQPLSAGCYSREATVMVYQRLLAKARPVLLAGHSVVVDATFAAPEDRQHLDDLVRQTGVPLEALWLQARQDQMIARVTARRGDTSDADAAVVRQQIETSSTSCPEGWIALGAHGTPDETAAGARQALGIGSGAGDSLPPAPTG